MRFKLTHTKTPESLTYTAGQCVAPHSSTSSQTCDLTVSLKSVAMETGEGQRVSDSKSEPRPPAKGWHTWILTRFQVVLCT